MKLMNEVLVVYYLLVVFDFPINHHIISYQNLCQKVYGSLLLYSQICLRMYCACKKGIPLKCVKLEETLIHSELNKDKF